MQKFTVASASIRNLLNQKENSLRDMDRWAAAAQAQGAELILFPELNACGYITAPLAREMAEPVPGPTTDQVIAIARRREMIIAFGMVEEEAGRYFCTHVLANGEGIIGKQRKIHTPAQEQPYWGCGGSIEVFDAGKAKIGITVCRDSFFDEMTRTLYFKGAEVVLMPFGYYNVPRSRYLRETIHGMSLVKACWTNGFYALVCNSAENRVPNQWEPQGRMFPGWAGVIGPWGDVRQFIDTEGNGEAMVVAELDPVELIDRRKHPNFLARELRPELYRFSN